MKTYKLLLTGLLCLGLFAACSDDNNDTGGITPTPGEGKGYMRLVLTDNFNKSALRTLPGDEDDWEVGTDDENAISEVLVALSYAADGEPNNTIDIRLVINNLSKTTDGEKTLITTYAFPVEPGKYRVWAIANPTEDMKSLGVGRDLADVMVTGIKPTSLNGRNNLPDTVLASGATKGKFMMYNTCNFADEQVYAEITVTEANDRENPAKNVSPIILERVSSKIESKVQVDNSESIAVNDLLYKQYFNEYNKEIPTTDKTKIKITYNGCVLLNGAGEFPLQQKWGADNWLLPTGADIENGYYYQLKHYRDYQSSSNKYGEIKYAVFNNLLCKEYEESPAVFYCMENKSESHPTGLIHRFKLTEEDKDEGKSPHFFYFCPTAEFTNDIEKLKELVRGHYHEDQGKNRLPDGSIMDDNSYTNDFLAELGNLNYDKLSTFHDNWDVKTYWEGEMYYIYDVEDQNYHKEGADKSGIPITIYDKAIYRNTIYKLTATKLGGLGSYLPEKEQDEKNWMEVTAEVKKWVLSVKNDIVLQ